MHRQLVYPGQIPLETDVLSTNKDSYIAVAKLAQALFGNNTTVNGLSCGPTGPASLAVVVQPGEIYSLQTVDTTAYSTLGTDSNQILKQGIITSTTTLNTPAPGTAGFSINYLVEVGFIESDANSVVLPYYNASNPSIAWSGPANSGTAQFTQRQDLATVQIKAGTAAATGTQTTPSPDAGYVGLWVVTVANGQATVTSANISAYSAAPFLHGSQNNPLFPINNFSATTNPAATNDNTQQYGIGSKWLNTSTNRMFMALGVATGAANWADISDSEITVFTSNGTFTPSGTGNYLVIAVGGGGGGGGGGGTNTTLAGQGGSGGSGGQLGFSIQALTAGTGYAVVIGTAGTAGTAGSVNNGGGDGGNGGNTTFNAVAIGTGGTGGRGGRAVSQAQGASSCGTNGGGNGGGQGGGGAGISNTTGAAGTAAAANTGGGGGGGAGGATNGVSQAGGAGGAGGTGILIVIRC